MKKQKLEQQITLEIEELEERIAPIVHEFSPIVAVGHDGNPPAIFSTETEPAGPAGGSSSTFGGGDQISGFPIPENTPGVGNPL